MITQSELREILDYDPATGVFVYRKKVAKKIVVGQEAGCTASDGYVRIRINGVLYLGHRLAWLHYHGEPVPSIIDHRNGFSNRISNLREATRSNNAMNSKSHRDGSSKFKGVSWSAKRGKWQASICKDRHHISLGRFDSEEEAARAYSRASAIYHGDFGRS